MRKDDRIIELLIILAVLTLLFWLGFHIAGALLSTAIWLFIKLPFAIILGGLGMVCYVTILLILLGGKCFKLRWKFLHNGSSIQFG